MEQKKHKRKNSHVVIVTSDAADASVKQFRIRTWLSQTIVVFICIGLGVMVGYFCFLGQIKKEQYEKEVKRQEQLKAVEEEKFLLEQEKAELEMKVSSLEETVQLLSETVRQKTESEEMLTEQLDKQKVPSEFPLNCSATMEVILEEEPICVFSASEGAMVISTANGVVTAVNDDSEYEKNVWIDHGNGYVTVYRNAGDIKVKQGEVVTAGTTLFLMNENSSKLGYQMLKDGVYINPMDMLAISG